MESFTGNVLENILTGSRRFIHPLELDRYLRHCGGRHDTIYIIEYESILVGLGYDRMEDVWINMFRTSKQLGVKVHVLSHKSVDDVIAAVGDDIFHEIHQCTCDDDRARKTREIAQANGNAKVVCVGTEFVFLIRSFSEDDFVYYVHSMGLPPWRSVREDTRERFNLSAPITIHRLYVFYLVAVAYFFASTSVLSGAEEVPSENADENASGGTRHPM